MPDDKSRSEKMNHLLDIYNREKELRKIKEKQKKREEYLKIGASLESYREPVFKKKADNRHDIRCDIYVPIDYSNVKSVIPPGEDIVYSTLCNVTAGTPVYRRKWTSHVLITTDGIAYTTPSRPKYVTWSFAYGIMRKQFQIGGTYFKLTWDPNYESKESFKLRKKEFSVKIRPYKKAYKANRKVRRQKRKEEKKKK